MTAPHQVRKTTRNRPFLIAIGAVVLVALIISAAVIVFSAKAGADSAASAYAIRVSNQLDAVIDEDDAASRADVLDEPVTLAPSQFGGPVSDSYRRAVELQQRYDAFAATAGPTLRARASVLDLAAFGEDLSAALQTEVTTDVVPVDDADSATRVQDAIDQIADKGERYGALADRFAAYQFDPKYDDLQAAVSSGLSDVAAVWTGMSEQQQTLLDKEYEILAIDTTSPSEEAKALIEERDVLIDAAQQNTGDLVAGYPSKSAALNDALSAFTGQISADGYVDATAAEAEGTRAQAKELRALAKDV